MEALCTQEQPPAAMAMCPLHVECRAVCAAVANGDFDTAYQTYEKTAVFPGILSSLCEEPCKEACMRKELGGAISMRKLEESACRYGKPGKKRIFLPRREDKVAVLGAGLYGLTLALELAKKGCKVTLYEKEEKLGGKLRTEGNIPEAILEKELGILKEYPIQIETLAQIEQPEELEDEYAEILCAYGKGFTRVIDAIYEGRKEAITVDRRLKKVSLMAGREREGSYDTSLYVETKGIEAVEPLWSETGYTKEEAIGEAGRCLDCKCLECVKGCGFLQYFKTFPRKYAREVYNNLSIAMGTRHANKMINACNLCGQCKAICPNGLDLAEFIKGARQIMVDADKMPESAFAFALEDMEQSNSKDCTLARHQKGFDTSQFVFFPGCQLGASVPQVVVWTYEKLTQLLDGGVGILLGCCGVTADWAGQTALFQEAIQHIKGQWEVLGRPQFIVACPTCYRVLAEQIGVEYCLGIWDVLLKDPALPEVEGKGNIVIKDACGAREYPQIHERMRTLLARMGYQAAEGEFSKEMSSCCGFGGLAPYSHPESADLSARLAVPSKDKNYVTYCMNCRDRYTKEGARAVHFLELLFDEEEGRAHKVPGWSSRQDNRVHLKETLMSRIWEEEAPKQDKVPLYYNAQLQEELEQRMILESDIRAVIKQAEETNSKLLHTETGCLVAHLRVKNVTFWVWYRPHDTGGYEIKKAYSHRMDIKEER